ncbi:hypothetical protein BpHYR1_047257 [Brachionus plicatilis]|uniref:Uncharacterized protein n=1 Tax=Brachionus plicatilis TaxID=10195 RepID=A0A3M7QXX7_BRAPC|nr:hypothetical protein BpHYR1_047257 [Brachionus plicatilis]
MSVVTSEYVTSQKKYLVTKSTWSHNRQDPILTSPNPLSLRIKTNPAVSKPSKKELIITFNNSLNITLFLLNEKIGTFWRKHLTVWLSHLAFYVHFSVDPRSIFWSKPLSNRCSKSIINSDLELYFDLLYNILYLIVPQIIMVSRAGTTKKLVPRSKSEQPA